MKANGAVKAIEDRERVFKSEEDVRDIAEQVQLIYSKHAHY